jgi:hypothetical protein
MNTAEAIAYIQAQTICALAEIEGMKAANAHRLSLGMTIAYDENAFFDVPNKYGIHHNAVLELLQSAKS